MTRTVRLNKVEEVYWKDLKAGDLVIVRKNERIPADLVLLACSNPEGTTFIDTSTLDGEKHPKPRSCIMETMASIGELVDDKFDIDLEMKVSVLQPDASLYHFEGFLNFVQEEKEVKMRVSCGIKNFVFKSAMIKTTDWVVGVVVYTGVDTKVQQNGSDARFKVSSLEKKMHIMIVITFLIQIVLSLFAIAIKVADDSNSDVNFDDYLEDKGADGEGQLWLIYIRYFILMSTMIPISLIVNLEVVRVFQAYTISINLDLKNKKEDR